MPGFCVFYTENDTEIVQRNIRELYKNYTENYIENE